MPFWFEKEEMRRFRRLNLPVKTDIRPQEGIKDAFIFAYGIDYLPPTVQQRITKSKSAMWHWVKHIQDQQNVLEPFFADFESYIQFFGQWIQRMAKGDSPRVDRKQWLEFHGYAKGVQRIQTINQSAPKTFQYFEALNYKMMMHFQHMSGCFEQSSASQFKESATLPDQFVIDAKAKRFEPDTFQNVPLAQALYHLNGLMTHYFDAYRQLIQDMLVSKNPKKWLTLELNISEGGAAIFIPKRFRANERCQLALYFDWLNHVIELDSVLVHCASDYQRNLEYNAFNFEFPSARCQRLIQLEMDRYEVMQSKKGAR